MCLSCSNVDDSITREALVTDNVLFGMMRMLQNERCDATMKRFKPQHFHRRNSDVLPPLVCGALGNLMAGSSAAAQHCRSMAWKIGLDRKLIKLLSASTTTLRSLIAKEASKALSNLFVTEHSIATHGSVYSTQTGLEERKATFTQLLQQFRQFAQEGNGNPLYFSLLGHVNDAAGAKATKELSLFKEYFPRLQAEEGPPPSPALPSAPVPLASLVSSGFM